ncbi:sigma-54 interaction domain-containing protein [Helicovermis profundi]|uniref:Sigma-54-dependent Fis family transcriptional regulator n=1 Tax=Helicovermis profundi TaxID=3065157 RepID=A0AAU9E3F7_9FIRM|nr:sigma-54-dependent Fis family transcriptional regulator [Clostridia bacterium S502]
MDTKIISSNLVQNILHEIQEGIHIVDKDGVTILYNSSMEKIEGLTKEDVIGKHILDVFPNWSYENSTLLTAIMEKRVVKKDIQSYFNFSGKKITTENITYPILDEDSNIIGAVEIAKNFTNVEKMSKQILKLRNRIDLDEKNEKVSRFYHFEDIVGIDKKFLNAIKIAKRATKTDSSVLIQGETGTGKELIAQSIHSGSKRTKYEFIAQNCAALPESLLEGILFGTSKGSFTGAENRAGLFEQANKGTLFLDEINSMSDSLQAKILRVLQEGFIRRVGGQKDIKVDVRIIAATNIKLKFLIDEGSFRKDLFYRINVINVNLPPLRERKDDIPMLTDYFIEKYNKKLGKDIWMLSEELKNTFKNYSWKGNIRELKNFIESAMNMVDDEHVISKEHIPGHIDEIMSTKSNIIENRSVKELNLPENFSNLNLFLENKEKAVIEYFLIENSYNLTRTAKCLSISRQNLQYKIKKYNLM